MEPPPRSYPTAIRGQFDDSATIADAIAAKDAAPPAKTSSPAPSRAPRPNRPQPLVTPLAVIPSQLVHPPANPTASATPAQTAQPVAAAAPSATGAMQTTPAIAAELTAVLPSDVSSGLSLTAASAAPAAAPAAIQGPPNAAAPAASGPAAAAAQPAAANVANAPLGQAQAAGVVVPASAATAASSLDPQMPPASDAADKQARLDAARKAWIEAMEEEIRRRRSESPVDEELPRLEQQLRLLYLAAGQIDDAVEAVASLDAEQSEAYKHVMFGLGVWLSPDESRRAPLRGAKVLHSLRAATSELASASKLEIRRLAFCEQVEYFGWYNEFPRNEFRPRQEVILYAEIDNFTAEKKGPAAYETELQGAYEIVDSSGRIVAARQLQLDKQTCRNLRRDYYLAYKFLLPDNLTPGRYRLELTIEDLKARSSYPGRKLADGVIEFSIR